MSSIDRRAAVAGIGLLLAAASGAVVTPHRRLADELPPLDLEADIPRHLTDWRIDRAIVPILPSADVQDRLDKLYNRVLARTYVNANGDRVMFLIAYGADQADRTTLAHIPEACYSSQGFDVVSTTLATIALGTRSLELVRLKTRRGARVEPVSYWTTVGDMALVGDVGRRWARARYALRGIIPDGMLVRVSSIDVDEARAFNLQAGFVADLFMNLPSSIQMRIFGVTA